MPIDRRYGSEAEYNGEFFDSNTEAAWAVCLDAADITWEREPETFEFNIHRKDGSLGLTHVYTPDFFLPEAKTYLEIKNDNVDWEAIIKLLLVSHATGELAILADGKPHNAALYIFDPTSGNLEERLLRARVQRADQFVPRFKWAAKPQDYPEPIPTIARHVDADQTGWSMVIDREVRRASKDRKAALYAARTIFQFGGPTTS